MVVTQSKLIDVLAVILISAALVSFSAPSHAQYVSDTDDLALLFCSYVQANDATGFRNTLRTKRLRLRDIYPRIRCNNYSMIQFAAASGAHDVGRFIAHSVLVDDMHSAGDIRWVENLEPTDPIAEVVRQRHQKAQYQD